MNAAHANVDDHADAVVVQELNRRALKIRALLLPISSMSCQITCIERETFVLECSVFEDSIRLVK